MFRGVSDHFVTARKPMKTGSTGGTNTKVRKTKLRQNFSQRTNPIHSIGPKTHVLGWFGPFRYGMKVDVKLPELVPLSHKFTKLSHVGIFRNECTRSTPLDPKLRFWGALDRFGTARKSL
jgi:hypothetical protein